MPVAEFALADWLITVLDVNGGHVGWNDVRNGFGCLTVLQSLFVLSIVKQEDLNPCLNS